MKKKVNLVAILILSLSILLVSCGGISKEKSIDIALKSLGLTRVYTPRNDSELNKSDNCYVVTVWTDSCKYVVKVDSKSVDVLSTETLPLGN